MQLSPEAIAAAEAAGVTFLPATPAQVQRLTMQRRIFYMAGQPTLATRGDGFYETAGTLQHLIEEGLQQQRDLAAWQQGQAPSPAPAAADAGTGTEQPEAAVVAEEPPAPPETPPPETPPVETAAEEAVAQADPPAEREAPPKRARRSRRPAPAPQLASVLLAEEPPGSPLPPLAEAGTSIAAGARSRQTGQRWLVAGAERRGRAAKHWSMRQR